MLSRSAFLLSGLKSVNRWSAWSDRAQHAQAPLAFWFTLFVPQFGQIANFDIRNINVMQNAYAAQLWHHNSTTRIYWSSLSWAG